MQGTACAAVLLPLEDAQQPREPHQFDQAHEAQRREKLRAFLVAEPARVRADVQERGKDRDEIAREPGAALGRKAV